MLVCGICHEDDLLDIGEIDSCEHRFCHECISKWSQIESKCPFCKVRFSWITRRLLTSPLKGNVSPSGPLVGGTVVARTEVPERDQRVVFEDPTFLEWLEGLACIICNGSENEDQLLLCDGCDQACHTYCLGLSSVPEEAWFCSMCQEARDRTQEAANDENAATIEDMPTTRSRRRSRSRSLTIVEDSEEEEEEEEDQHRYASVFIDDVSVEPTRRSRRIQTARSAEHRRRYRRVEGTPVHRHHGDRERIASLQENWESLREGSMSFEEILDTSGDEGDETRMTNRDSKRARKDSPTIDLTCVRSPERSPNAGVSDRLLRAGQFSPPLLDLRSRIQRDLLDHEKEYVGLSADSFMTPNHQKGVWRQQEGRVTTLGDLTFGASVAAGRTTPKSSGKKGSTPAGVGSLFAHKTQAMVHAMAASAGCHANAGGSSSPKPLRERMEMRYGNNDRFNGASIRSVEYLNSRQAPLECRTNRKSPSSASHARQGICQNKALELVDEQIELLFGSELPLEKQKHVRYHAVRNLCQRHHPEEINGDHAAWAVDEVLKAMSNQPH